MTLPFYAKKFYYLILYLHSTKYLIFHKQNTKKKQTYIVYKWRAGFFVYTEMNESKAVFV